jgi:hypothetical protein
MIVIKLPTEWIDQMLEETPLFLSHAVDASRSLRLETWQTQNGTWTAALVVADADTEWPSADINGARCNAAAVRAVIQAARMAGWLDAGHGVS